MEYQITMIHLSDEYAPVTTEKITRVRLSDRITEKTVEQVVKDIDDNYKRFYTYDNSTKTYVETVHPSNRKAYIRSEANGTTKDNLLSLDRF